MYSQRVVIVNILATFFPTDDVIQCGPQNLNTEGMHMVQTEATPTLLMIDIYHYAIFHQKCNYCGVLNNLKG